MSDQLSFIGPRGPHGGLTATRRGQALSDDAMIATWQAVRRAVSVLDGRLAAWSPGEYAQTGLFHEALAHLAASPNRMLPMSELATAIGVTSGGLTKLVDRLVQAGFAYRRHSISDRRVVFAVLTEVGVRHESRSTPAYAAQLRAEFSHVCRRDLTELRRICEQLEPELGEPAATASDDHRKDVARGQR